MKTYLYILSLLLANQYASGQKIGINTLEPTEQLDVADGNVRIRTINSNVSDSETDRIVVADESGVLKTINADTNTLFYSQLLNSQNISNMTALLFGSPIVTSEYYSYMPETGDLTFNAKGNYLVTLQLSFSNIKVNSQRFIVGIRSEPDKGAFLGKGSFYLYGPRTGTVGSTAQYTNVISANAGQKVQFVVSKDGPEVTVLANETGTTGSGNVTNLTIKKINNE